MSYQILIVEDEIITVDYLEAILENAGYNFPIFPIEFRPCPADGLWLSAAYKRDITAFAILSHRHGKCDRDGFYTEIMTLLKPYDYRVHWGMWISESTEYLSTQYERWNDFLKLREKMDPDCIFEQPILGKIFGYYSWVSSP